MKRTITLVVAALLAGTASHVCGSQILFVAPPDGGGDGACANPDFHTIQAAVDAARPGDTIRVCGGTYNESVNIVDKNPESGSEADQIIITAAVFPDAALSDQEKAIITPAGLKGAGAHYAVTISNSRYITLSGFDLREATKAAVRLSGKKSNHHVILDANDVHHNAAGGIVIDAGHAPVQISNNLVRENAGNGVWIKGGPSDEDSAITVEKNIFLANAFNGMRVGPGTVNIEQNLFVRNGATANPERSWGLVHDGGSPEEITLTDNIFDRNGPENPKKKQSGGDIARVSRILDAGDARNYTTTGIEGPDADGVNPAAGIMCCTDGDVSMIAELLRGMNFETSRIAGVLRDIYGVSATDAAVILRGVGVPASEVAEALRDVFRLGIDEVARILLDEAGYALSDVALALTAAFGATPDVLLGVFLDLGRPVTEIVEMLATVYSSTAEEIAGYLYNRNFDLPDIVSLLKGLFGSTEEEMRDIFLALGIDIEDIAAVLPTIQVVTVGWDTYFPGVCGDNWCDHPTENHANCPADCFAECYGAEQLCSRRYDQVLVAGTHNANVAPAYGVSLGIANQSHSLTRQLDDGIRHMDLDIDYCESGSEEDWAGSAVCLCHGDDTCQVFGGVLALDGLREIYNWLVANPSEVVTLNFEEYTTEADFEAVLVASGLAQLALRRPPSACENSGEYCTADADCPDGPGKKCSIPDYWPMSLNNMARRNQRVVIFDTSYDGSADWIHGNIKKTGFGVALDDEWPCTDPASVTQHTRFGLEHVRSLVGLGDAIASTCANATQNILNHISKCENKVGPVNFFIVDFYETNTGPLEVVNIVNGVTAIDDLYPDGGCNCHKTSDCAGDEFCLALFCTPRAPNGTPCVQHDNCLSDICNFGFCIGEPQPAGVPCTADRACISNVCNGLCASICGDGVCEFGESCYSSGEFSCQSDCGKCPSGAPCVSNNDCSSDICNYLFCIPEPLGLGAPCTTDNACKSDNCVAGFCVPST